MTQLSTVDIARLREALLAAAYHVEPVHALLGTQAHSALARGERVPALRATEGGSPLATLVRLFLIGADCGEPEVRRAFHPLPLETAAAARLVGPATGGTVRAGLDLRPYGEGDTDWWVVSDIAADVRPGPLRRDHVLGVGGASVTLAQATVRRPAGSALDLGVGCGVQSLHLSRHVRQVTGTDVNPRALRLAALTAGLNGHEWELLPGVPGDFFAPVAGRRFDLIVSNPPFVIGPGDSGYLYRDSGIPGDGASRRLLRDVPAYLADGGWCQLLANWVHTAGEPWQDRIAGWLDGTGCDAWVWQREVQDPGEYVSMWLRDGGEEGSPAYEAKYGRWLDWLAGHEVAAVGFGIVTLHNSGRTDPVVRIEEVRHRVEQPTGPHIATWFDRQDWLRDVPDLRTARLRAAPAIQLEQRASIGEGGWAVDVQRLVLPDGLRFHTDVDTITVDLVAGCDGTNRLGDQIAVLAHAYGYAVDELTAGALPAVRYLVERGFLLPA